LNNQPEVSSTPIKSIASVYGEWKIGDNQVIAWALMEDGKLAAFVVADTGEQKPSLERNLQSLKRV
jgi:hypothetical protein